MMTRVALSLMLLLPVSASAKKLSKKPIERISAEQVAELVADDGEVEITKDSVGDPLIKVTGELSYVIQFYDCDDDGCESIQFRTWFGGEGVDLRHELFVAYSMKQRIGRVYKDQDGDAVLETLAPLTGGVRLAHVVSRHADFMQSAGLFVEFLRENL